MEDDVAAARLLQKCLQRIHYMVDIAPDGAQGVAMFNKGGYDVVVVDQKMPVYDGLQVIRRIIETQPDAPVIMLTGGGDESVAVEAMKSGAADYIVKDVDGRHLELLPTVIERMLERKKLEAEHARLERQVQHAQKLESLGVLAGGIAHDFNNLLMGILGNADVALIDIPDTSPARRRIMAIKEAGKRASELCDQLLGYSGRGQFIIEPMQVNTLVADMANLLEVSISKKVDIRYDFQKDLPLIEADGAQLQQVVMNLITNASDAIGDAEGVIRLRTGVVLGTRGYLADAYIAEDLEEKEYVFIEVTDTGSGMDEETVASIFDPFFTTKATGRGLGLAAVLGIIRAHGGTIKLKSEPGRGTTFTVLFPVGGVQQLKQRPKESQMDENWQAGGRILIVDDEELVCDISKAMLSRSGFDVDAAESGREAIRILNENPEVYCLVILDMTMPDMNGHEVFREIRTITQAPILLATGYAEQDTMSHFQPGDLAGFIHKPYERNALLRKIKGILNE